MEHDAQQRDKQLLVLIDQVVAAAWRKVQHCQHVHAREKRGSWKLQQHMMPRCLNALEHNLLEQESLGTLSKLHEEMVQRLEVKHLRQGAFITHFEYRAGN